MALLAHPIDVHYALKGIDGWPRFRLEVYGVDSYGRVELAGYGCCIVPTAAGTHELRCVTWRPCGSLREQFSSAPRPHATHTHITRVLACSRARRARRAPRPLPACFDPASSSHNPACMRASCAAFFLGGGPRLKQKELVTAQADRYRLQTEPSGEVLLQLSVMPKDLARHGVIS